MYCQSFFKISNNILLSIAASVGSPRDMTTEEMRKLLERNEIVGGGGGKGLLIIIYESRPCGLGFTWRENKI